MKKDILSSLQNIFNNNQGGSDEDLFESIEQQYDDALEDDSLISQGFPSLYLAK